jgi:RecA-family ATPase
MPHPDFEAGKARYEEAKRQQEQRAKANGSARDRASQRRYGAASPIAPLRILEPEKWQGKAVPETRWIIHNVLPVCSICTLGGHGETGKSILALQLGVARALDRDWLGFPTTRGKTLIVSCEDPENVVWSRIAGILKHYDADFFDLGDRLRIIDRVDLLNSFMEWENRWKPGEETPFLFRIHNLALDIGADLIIVDSRYDVFGGEQNDTPQVHQFMSALRTVAVEIDGVVLILAHPSRTGLSAEGDGESGSVAWHNKVRSRLYLRAAIKEHDGDCDRILEHLKNNYGPKFEPLRLTWHDGAFAADRPATGVLASIEQSAAEKAFLEALAKLAAQRANVSASPTSNNYAPIAIIRARLAGKCRKADLADAMHRLLDAGRIAVEQYGRTSDPRFRLVEVNQK